MLVAVALTSRPPQVKTYGSYAVSIQWPGGPNDVDLYVRDPSRAICYFHDVQVDQMQLEHDDLGTPDGLRQGQTERGADGAAEETPGQYVVDTHLFTRGARTAPIPVSVQLWDLQGDDRLVKSRTVYVTHTGDMRTRFRFTVDDAGATNGFSYVPVNLMQTTTTSAGGA